MDDPADIASRIDVDFGDGEWEVIDKDVHEDEVHLTAENRHMDVMTFVVVVKDVNITPGPPLREDYEPDRLEPGDEF